MKLTKTALKQIIKEEVKNLLESQDEQLKNYSPISIELAKKAIESVDYPHGASVENKIHRLIDEMPDINDDDRWTIADEALSVAGIMTGVGADAL